MATISKYSYSIANDTLDGTVNPTVLTSEIAASAIIIALDHIDTGGDLLDIWFKDILSPGDQSLLFTIVNNHKGTPSLIPEVPIPVSLTGPLGPIPQNNDKHLLMSQEPRTGSEFITCSHNFTDKVTWFGSSIRVTENLVDSGDGYRFNGSYNNWIDMVTGRVRGDDDISSKEPNGHGYLVNIFVDGYEKNLCPIFSKNNGDYWINYEDGYVIFLESQAGKSVEASYSYATTSEFVLEPYPNTILDIEYAESDFSNDVIMHDTIQYIVYGYVDVFAPELMPDIPSGTQIPLTTYNYKRFQQILNEAVGAFPSLAPNAATEIDKQLELKEFRRTSRGVKTQSVSVPFRYGTKRSLISSAGMKLVVKLLNDIPFDGELVAAAFYGTVRDE